MSAAGEKVAKPKWNAPLRVRQMYNHGGHATDGSGWQWEITDRHGLMIADQILREEAEHIIECVNSHTALLTQRDALEAREKVLVASNWIETLRRQQTFSERAFGPGARHQGICDHIRKELHEIEAKPSDLMEWIDVAMLAFDGAWRSGHSPEQIVAAYLAKLAKNEGRVWPDWRTADPNKAIEHDRDHDALLSPGEPQS